MERMALLGLALMLAYVLIAFIVVFCQFRSARHARTADFTDQRFRRERKVLLAKLGIWIAPLKGIGLTAPYLGVAGTILGLLDAFTRASGTAISGFALVAPGASAALLSTAAGLMVAVLAIASYNCLRARLEILQKEISKDAAHRSSHFHAAQRLPLSPRFSAIALAPAAAIFIVAFALPWSFGPPVGLPVGVAPDRCEFPGEARQIVLHLTEGSKLFMNTEQTEWGSLEFRLSQIYKLRADRTLYLLADDRVPSQDVADAIDIAENVRADMGLKTSDRLRIRVRLITPHTMAARCPQPIPIRSGSRP